MISFVFGTKKTCNSKQDSVYYLFILTICFLPEEVVDIIIEIFSDTHKNENNYYNYLVFTSWHSLKDEFLYAIWWMVKWVVEACEKECYENNLNSFIYSHLEVQIIRLQNESSRTSSSK